MIPTLVTDRMTLRAPVLADFEPYGAILMSERGRHMGGPMTRYHAWLDFCMEVASWQLRGFGALSMVERRTERFLGMVLLHHDEGDPEPELGWVITETAEGHGFATEAARAARAYFFDAHGGLPLVSYIAPENTGSVAVAERLGAIADPDAKRPVSFPKCLVYRHPDPEMVQ